jgi:hypothetical protein
MKKLILIALALGVLIPAKAEHQKISLQLSLYNAERFNITINGQTTRNVYDFETFVRPGKHFVKVWMHERTHQGGHVKVLHSGYIHVGNRRNMSGVITHHGDIQWRENRRHYQRTLSDLYRDMDDCGSDYNRLSLALSFTADLRLSAYDFEMILNHFDMDHYRYEFASSRYDQCYEPQFFYRCANTINSRYKRQQLMARTHHQKNKRYNRNKKRRYH